MYEFNNADCVYRCIMGIRTQIRLLISWGLLLKNHHVLVDMIIN